MANTFRNATAQTSKKGGREIEGNEDDRHGRPRWVLPEPGRYIPTTIEEDGQSYQGWEDKKTGKVVLGVPMRSRGRGKAKVGEDVEEEWEYKTLDAEAFKKAYQEGNLALWAYPSSKLQSMLSQGEIMEDEYSRALADQEKYGSTWFQSAPKAKKPARGAKGTWFGGAE